MRRSLPLLLLAFFALACAPRREAVVPFAPADALTRASRILESFEYNVVEVDPEEGLVRGVRSAEHLSTSVLSRGSRAPAPSEDVLWQVTVHVTPSGDGSLYRLEADATSGAYRLEDVDPVHLDRLLEALAEWRR